MMKKAPMVIAIIPKNLTLIRKYYLGLQRIQLATAVGMNDYHVKKGETMPESKEAEILCNFVRKTYEKIKDIPQFKAKGIILQ